MAKSKRETLYVAYGSNLWRMQMAHRCPAAEPVGRLMLPNWRLVFRRFADLDRAPGESVPAAVYRLTERCEEALDAYEGVRVGAYFKEELHLKSASLGEFRALIYLKGEGQPIQPPSPQYVTRLRAGYSNWKFREGPLETALRECGYYEEQRELWHRRAQDWPLPGLDLEPEPKDGAGGHRAPPRRRKR